MKLATWKRGETHSFGIIASDNALHDIGKRSNGAFADLASVIAAGALERVRALVSGLPDGHLDDVTLLPPLPRPGKIICVGVNYPERNAEYNDGSDLPKYPSLFVRFPATLVGHGADIIRPRESVQFDYEGEIVLVIGKAGRRIPESTAKSHIFGITLMNEGSVRDWVRHGKFNVTPGKNFERSGSIGPWIVPVHADMNIDDLTLTTTVNGEERQRGNTGALMFPFARIISYISTFITLEPGDLIATGTPPGAGGRFDPPKWLVPGDSVEVSCDAVGVLRNTVADEAAA